jgi:leader peptidase (prepilin peptidase)/N-methyltransferase
MALGNRKRSAQIPFGPYLALGALVWMFFGAWLIDWYVHLLS